MEPIFHPKAIAHLDDMQKRMLDVIEKQRAGEENDFILRSLSNEQLHDVARFITSFDPADNEEEV